MIRPADIPPKYEIPEKFKNAIGNSGYVLRWFDDVIPELKRRGWSLRQVHQLCEEENVSSHWRSHVDDVYRNGRVWGKQGGLLRR